MKDSTHEQRKDTYSDSLAVVAAVNDGEVLSNNLAVSPMLAEDRVPLIIERGHQSAASAYNAGLDRTTADVVIFAHQDVYLPRGWEAKLITAIDALNHHNKNWAVLGIIGVDTTHRVDATHRIVGRVWSSGLGCEIGCLLDFPVRAVSIDELAIVLRKEARLRFDEDLPGYHLYGTDIVQMALQKGFEAYVFNAPVIHNSVPVLQLDRSYRRAYRYMQHKWWRKLPIHTTVVPITRSGWPLMRSWLSTSKQRLFGQLPRTQRREAPFLLARELGYEKKQ